MRSNSAAVIAATLAGLWLAAVAADSAPAVGLVTVAAMAAPVLLAPRRRRHALLVGSAGVASAVAAVLLLTARFPSGVPTLVAMLGSAALAAAVLPVVYALTFDDDPPEPP